MNPRLLPLVAGLCGSTLATAAAAGRVHLKTGSLRDVTGVSLGMYGAMTAGEVLWLVYGVLIRSSPLAAANVVTLSLAGSILAMKLVLGRRRPE